MKALNVENIKFYSDALAKDTQMTVFLPEGYNHMDSLPVLYFLHGRSGNENIMYELEINTVADQMIRAETIQPIIIVCPNIGNSRGINSSPVCKEVPDKHNRIINIGMYEDYLIKDIIQFIDKTYHTINTKQGRYIGGASAGGYAALHSAFRHPRLFSKAGGHMPALELELADEDRPYFTDENMWGKYDPISIARSNELSSDLEVYLDAGDKDEGQFYQGCALLYDVLKQKGVTVQNHVFPGHHNEAYIKSNMEKYLAFYGQN